MTAKKNLSAGSLQRTSESLLKDIRRNTKRIFTSEQKVLIVMEGIRGEQSIAELCRKYGRPILPISKSRIGAGIISLR